MSHVSHQMAVTEQWRPRSEELIRDSLVFDHQSITGLENNKPIFPSQRPGLDLELQNYALLKIRHQLEQELERYTDLYDFAPIGYMAMASDTTIQKINLEGAILLGVARHCLVKKRFDEFVSMETLPVFKDFLQRMWSGANRESCEIILNLKEQTPVRLEGIGLGSTGGWLSQIIILDMTDHKQTGELLKLSEARYHAAIESHKDLICRFLPDGILTFVNPAYCGYFGHIYNNRLATSFVSVIPEDVQADLIARTKDGSADRPSNTCEHRVTRADGQSRWVQWTNQAILDSNRCLIEIQSVGRDITEQRLAEEALRHSEERCQRIVEMVQEGVWQVNAQGHITFINARMAEILGYTIVELMGQSLFDETIFMDKVWRERAKGGVENSSYGTVEQHEVQFRRKDGEVIWIRVSINSIFDSQGCYSGALGMTMDMTDCKLMEEDPHLSTTVRLTGLFNRCRFMTVARHEFERSQYELQPLVALMLDISQFRLINDTFGSRIGDQVLQQVIRTMRSTLRRTDLLGRYDGEKFVMLLPETTLSMAITIAKRLSIALTTEPIITDKGTFIVTVSIGVAALMDQSGLTLEQLLERADQALYAAKQPGNYQVQVWPGRSEERV